MRPSRDRTFAVYDKKQSLINYLKLDNENENKAHMIKRLSGDSNVIDVNALIEECQNEFNFQLPQPPKFSETNKNYLQSETKSKILIHERAKIINSFDRYDIIDNEMSFVNLQNYLSKFQEDELSELKIKDILTFDPQEFVKIKNKFEEFKDIGKKFNDTELNEFFDDKIQCVEEDKKKIKLILNHLDKIEDFIILDEILKFFLKKSKK
jgi:hypothetical protein